MKRKLSPCFPMQNFNLLFQEFIKSGIGSLSLLVNREPQVCHEGLVFVWGNVRGHREQVVSILSGQKEGGLVDLPPVGLHSGLTTSSSCCNFPAGEEQLHGFPSSFCLAAINTEQNLVVTQVSASCGTNSRGRGKHLLLRKQNQGVLSDTAFFYT